MKLSITGRLIHFYTVSAKIVTRLCYFFGALMFISLAIILFVPGFDINKAEHVTSTYGPMAFAQAAVGITLLGSMAACVILGLSAFFFITEIFVEIPLKKKAMQIIREKKKITLPELAREMGIYENELGMMVGSWARGIGKGKHLKLNYDEISWV